MSEPQMHPLAAALGPAWWWSVDVVRDLVILHRADGAFCYISQMALADSCDWEGLAAAMNARTVPGRFVVVAGYDTIDGERHHWYRTEAA